jgi:hypothetical protein
MEVLDSAVADWHAISNSEHLPIDVKDPNGALPREILARLRRRRGQRRHNLVAPASPPAASSPQPLLISVSFTDDDMEEASSEQLLALIDSIKTTVHAEESSSLQQGAQWKDCLKVHHLRSCWDGG